MGCDSRTSFVASQAIRNLIAFASTFFFLNISFIAVPSCFTDGSNLLLLHNHRLNRSSTTLYILLVLKGKFLALTK
jgi:hypothetical protein